MMNLAGRFIFAPELKANHAAKLLGEGIADNGYDTGGTTCYHRESQGIVATDDIKIVRLVLDDFIYLLQTATGLLDANDIVLIVFP